MSDTGTTTTTTAGFHGVLLVEGKEVATQDGDDVGVVVDALTAEGKRRAGEGVSSVMVVRAADDAVAATGEFIAVDSADGELSPAVLNETNKG